MENRIKTFNQFNESFYDKSTPDFSIQELDVEKDLDLKYSRAQDIKKRVLEKFNSMTPSEKKLIFDEIEKVSNTLDCDIEDLEDPVFIKNHLDELATRHISMEEGFWSDIKQKLFDFFLKIFEWGTAIVSILTIVISSIDGNFTGVFTGGMALAISIIASAYLYTKYGDRK